MRRYALRLHEEYTHGIVYRGGNRVQLKKPEGEETRAARKELVQISQIFIQTLICDKVCFLYLSCGVDYFNHMLLALYSFDTGL